MPLIPAGSRYVAMGSSFAAGPGIAPRDPASPFRARQSARNYPHLVARALGLELHDVSYSGATTSDILQPSPIGAAAQLDAVTPDTRLVTITVGGNDVGYLGRLTLASLPWPLRVLPSIKASITRSGDPTVVDEGFAALGENLEQIGRRIRDGAPDSRVLFVDYLTILPPDDDGRDDEDGCGSRRLRVRRGRRGIDRPSRLVGRAVDAALRRVPPWLGALPSERCRDGGRRGTGARRRRLAVPRKGPLLPQQVGRLLYPACIDLGE